MTHINNPEEISFAYFTDLPLKTEKEVEEYMSNLGISYYEKVVKITIDAKNTSKDKLNKNHPLYNKIKEAKEKGVMNFEIYL